ncbi:hypothetical protein [Cohnella thailandensis]|uniref:DUF4367 domain-containing protein n=1 Tax=Cohnella thailandensis TaxID=557557 RepID=A0A841SR22_9BACL|nr:hypothetical protein [Cohnella thailandensis]MBB6633652.1 hypothetical protein [Cohnella thailandensis]MBP1976437.1 hypothetical protein [Cohnella thailandensis]
MEQARDSLADSKLRMGGRKEERFREIDIVDAVMGRVRRLDNGPRKARRPRRLTKTAVLAAAGSLVLLGSVAGYAATEYVKLKDSQGRVVIETIEASKFELPKDIGQRMSEYRDRVHAALKQDEMAAYYIKDDEVNAYAAIDQIDFESKLEYDTYGDYESRMQSAKAPYLPKPDSLPRGYEFEFGKLTPRPPLRGDPGNEFEQIRDRLKSAAEAAKKGEILFMETVKWKSILNSKLVFAKGSAKIELLATTGAENGTPKATISQRESDRSESVRLSDAQQAVYVRDDGLEATNTNTLAWYDEASNIYYSIYADSSVTRDEMLRIGKSIVQAAGDR